MSVQQHITVCNLTSETKAGRQRPRRIDAYYNPESSPLIPQKDKIQLALGEKLSHLLPSSHKEVRSPLPSAALVQPRVHAFKHGGQR